MSARTSILPGRYEAPRLVGRGGMGEIYVARTSVLGRTVAVKLLVERFAEEPELRERFRREALTAARLSGEPHVVTIFDVGEHGGGRSPSWSTSRAERWPSAPAAGRCRRSWPSPGWPRPPPRSTRPTRGASSTAT